MVLNYYDVTNFILTAQPAELDPDSNLYQEENVWKKYKRLSRKITVVNVGPGILYVRVSHDGVYTSEESIIFEGESKDFDEIYLIKLRSPTANLRYRFTEYNVTTVSGQQFSGSRFKERRNREGVIVFQDDYESPTIKFDTSFSAPGGSIVRSTDFSYSGDFSIKTITPPVVGDDLTIEYIHPDFHIGKLGAQIRFSSLSAFDVHLRISYYNGITRYRGDMVFRSNGRLQVLQPGGAFITMATNIPVFLSNLSFNSLKLTVDISNLVYVSAIVNGFIVDLSGILLGIFSSTVLQHIKVDIQNHHFSGPIDTVYFDDYIFTEDEI